MRDYVQEFFRLDLQQQVKVFSKRIHLRAIKAQIRESFCSELMKRAFENLVERRHQELRDELGKRS